MKTFKVNKKLKENMSELADVENKDFGVVDNVYAAAIRDFRKTKKQKEDAVKVKDAEKLDEKPKKPEMNRGAKQMKLEKLMLEESLFESVNGVMTRDELLKDSNLKDVFNKLQDENNILLSNWRDFNDLESFAYAGTIHHDTDRDGSEILFCQHFGSSAVKYTLEKFRWLIEEIFDEKGLHFLLTSIKEFNDKKEEFYNREFDKRQKELDGLNESLEDAEKLRGEYFEFPNGEVFTIDFKDGKLIAGGLTNAGVMPEFEIEYDDDFSADWNLQVLYDVCIEARPELLGRYSDEYLKERDTKQESIKTRRGVRKLGGLREGIEKCCIKYWRDEVARDQGDSDIYETGLDKEHAIDIAKRLVDRGNAASVEVLKSPSEEIETEDDIVVFGYDGEETWGEESETKGLKESKQLNEGAGAGYTIEGELHDIVVNKINNIEIHDDKTAFGTPAKFARIDLDADALFDGSANSYYYGDTLDDAKVKIISLDVNPNLIYDLGLPEFEYDKIELQDLNDRMGFGSTLKFKSDVIGGGWSHLPFDGKVKSTRVDNDYMSYVDGIEFEFIEPSDVEFIDKAVQGETEIEENDIEE